MLLEAGAALALVRSLLAVTSLSRSQALLAPIARASRQPPLTPAQIVRLVHGAAARRGLRASCVPRALAAWVLLSRAGHDADICFGVEQGAGGERLSAHAWVEIAGRPVAEPDDLLQRFCRLNRRSPDPA